MALATQIVETQLTHGPEIIATDWRVSLPVLAAGMVTLRELRASDAPDLIELFTSERVARFTSPVPTSVADFERYIQTAHEQRAAGRGFCFAVVPRGSTAVMGLVRVRGIDSSGVAEWEFALASECWGTGLFTDGAQALLEFVFERVGINRLEARTCLMNGRGNGALAKLGAVKEAILRKSFRHKDDYVDQVLWSILRQDWRQSKAVFGTAVIH